ncbi:MAG: DEAD/DEAH box helicase [Anaerolineales bacterium]|nr:DEAD/DEAH box helicase [Anaerolineales bacterium]
MSLNSLLAYWKTDPETVPNLAVWKTTPPRPAETKPFPTDLPDSLDRLLQQQGIPALYRHQAEAWELSRSGCHVVIATSTASGKTLAYNLPVLAGLLENPEARALYLFPTKALAQDQFQGLRVQASALEPSPGVGIYDGDTRQQDRAGIRQKARIVLTNPDMLHTGILPHHTLWEKFFRSLKFVVIDEVHTYRGVFGSHVANVLRRLKRVCRFYGADPQFILTSATIGNPQELAEGLVEAPVALVDQDGSARGERHFLIYNPPVVDESLGLRKSALMEAVRLAQDLQVSDVQSVVFARSRRSVEMILSYLQEAGPRDAGDSLSAASSGKTIRGYRSGYLPSQRREIEKGLRDGSVRLVVATNALELGIDIGGLGAALLTGYPGTIASTWQQAGRAGRGDAPAVSVLIATPAPLDQFLAHHPEYFFARSPEQALINPDHLVILLNHLRSAAFELPFRPAEGFGELPMETVNEFLAFLEASGELHASEEKYFWMADKYPAAAVSLRSASPETVVLHAEEDGVVRTIGTVDLASASWMVHPRAVYLHQGQQYYVQELDLETNTATLIPVALDYYTQPQRRTEISLLSEMDRAVVPGGEKFYGEMQVTTQAAGFRKVAWLTYENLGEEPLDLPPTEFQTTGYWLTLAEDMVAKLSVDGLWANAPNDYGPGWAVLRDRVRARDDYTCQNCGRVESRRQHDVHHKVPFRSFKDEQGRILREKANRPDNLVTLCPECHHRVESSVRMRSGLAGLSYVFGQLAPLFLMCDSGDLGVHADPAWAAAQSRPAVVLYDNVPGGIGFSQKLFDLHAQLAAGALELVSGCACQDGCPSCVGPGGENGVGGKQETLAILRHLEGSS